MEPESKKFLGFIDSKWLPALGISAGLAIVGAGAYFLLSRSGSGGDLGKRAGQGKVGEHSLLENNSIITNLANSLLHESNQYSLTTLEEIINLMEEHARESYCEAILRSREARRPLRDSNFEEYCAIIQNEMNEHDEIITQVLNIILDKIGGNFQTYQASVAYWIQRDQRLATLQMTMAERWKLHLRIMTPPKQPID